MDSHAEEMPKNTIWITVSGSGTAECDGVYCPSQAPPKVSESGTKSSLGYWNGKMAWDRADGKAARNPSISYSDSYKSWRIARLDGHLAYQQYSSEPLPHEKWEVYVKKGTAPAPTIMLHDSDPRGKNPAAKSFFPRPNVVFVLGGPGAGKGTMCELAKNQLGWEHLSAGDLLRAERKKGGAQGELIEGYITAGKLVPDEITVGLLKEAMQTTTDSTGHINFLIDGFPRSTKNYDAWVKVMGDDGANEVFMFLFECPLPVLEQRILGRAKYSGRSDDNVESLRKRFVTYKDETMPIVDAFQAKGKLVQIDSSMKREEVYATVKEMLKGFTDPSAGANPLTERSEILLGLRPYPKKEPKKTE